MHILFSTFIHTTISYHFVTSLVRKEITVYMQWDFFFLMNFAPLFKGSMPNTSFLVQFIAVRISSLSVFLYYRPPEKQSVSAVRGTKSLSAISHIITHKTKLHSNYFQCQMHFSSYPVGYPVWSLLFSPIIAHVRINIVQTHKNPLHFLLNAQTTAHETKHRYYVQCQMYLLSATVTWFKHILLISKKLKSLYKWHQ